MSLFHLFNYARGLSPSAAVSKLTSVGVRRTSGWVAAWRHKRACTYEPRDSARLSAPPGGFANNLISNYPSATGTLAIVTQHFVNHEFNLLGSEYVACDYVASLNKTLTMLLSPGNQERAAALRQSIAPSYAPIDWQLDFKSGYRWRENQWAALVPYGHIPGVDIKVPWELARCQHLPLLGLAWRCACAETAGFETAEVYAQSVRNQVLDFIAANPPGFGVNWACTMDVAIRAANLVLTSWLLEGCTSTNDDLFREEFAASLLAHGRHIANNLEWSPDYRGNHYLANIAGLAFIARALEQTLETDTWLAFAAHELSTEVERQFMPDGSGFEGSTSYHRLSGEMAIYSSALLLGLDDIRIDALTQISPAFWPNGPSLPKAPIAWHDATGPFTANFCSRLERLAAFSMHITKPNNNIVQIGDNDNGRFFKISVGNLDLEGHENHLDHRGLVAASAGLFAQSKYAAFAGPGFTSETRLVQALSGGRHLPRAGIPGHITPADHKHADNVDAIAEPRDQHETIIYLPNGILTSDLDVLAYPNFGIYIWRSSRLFLSMRCGPIAHDGRGGHAHNDQLAIELNVDGEDWLADPGSYTYTGAPDIRNAYRSVRAHAAPRLGDKEPSPFNLGLFNLADHMNAHCLDFRDGGMDGVHWGFGTPVFRSVRLQDNKITIRDRFGTAVDWALPAEDTATAGNAEELQNRMGSDIPFSPGYGLRHSTSQP